MFTQGLPNENRSSPVREMKIIHVASVARSWLGSGGQWWKFFTRRDLTLMVNKLFFWVFPNIALLYSRVVNCYELLLLITPYIYIYIIHMIVDLKVHVEIFHYKGRQGSNMRPRESFFSEFAKVLFVWGERFSKKT